MAYFLAFYFGTIIGSFLNVLILRLPKGEGLSGRSHCNHCGHKLSWPDLFPLFSYLRLLGKCRYCNKRFSSRYFWIEAATGALFALAYWRILPLEPSQWLELAQVWLLIAASIVVFMVDLEHFLIFDDVLLAAGLPILAANIFLDFFYQNKLWAVTSLTFGGLFAGGLFAGFFYLLWLFSRGRWIGFGDVKLMLFLGIALGWPKTAAAWMLAYLSGMVFALPLLISGRKQLTSRLPFGCFLALGALLAVFFGEDLVAWYWKLIGFY